MESITIVKSKSRDDHLKTDQGAKKACIADPDADLFLDFSKRLHDDGPSIERNFVKAPLH